ncbi:MAG: hypothetical protein KC503_23520 [Myxococcales bacterium]|nr:hypothetical protein [Myxococcales bacterium]
MADVEFKKDHPGDGKRATNATLLSMWGSGNRIFAAGGIGSGSLVQSDGDAWRALKSGGHGLRGVWGASPETIYAVGEWGTVLRSTDGGSTIDEVEVEGVSGCIYKIDGDGDFHVFACGDSGAVLRSEDEGQSFQVCETGVSYRLLNIWVGPGFGSSGVVWAVGDGGTILRSDSGGETWEARDSGVSSPLCSLCGASDDDVWIVGDGGVLLRSADGGARFERIDLGVSADLEDICLGPYGEMYVVGSGGLVASSHDGGRTFKKHDKLGRDHLWSVFCSPLGVVYIGAENGVIWRGSGGSSGLAPIPY